MIHSNKRLQEYDIEAKNEVSIQYEHTMCVCVRETERERKRLWDILGER